MSPQSRRDKSGNVTMRYARLAQMMATEQSISITLGRLTFTIRIATARQADHDGGQDGRTGPRRDV